MKQSLWEISVATIEKSQLQESSFDVVQTPTGDC